MATSVPSVAARPFAHLAGGRGVVKKADEPNDQDENDDTDADEDEDDDGDDDTDENGKKTKKSKKAKKAEDDSDEKDEDKPDASAARRREKARIRTIVDSVAGKRLPAAALNLALNSAMPRHAAVRLLAKMSADVPQAKVAGLRERMARENLPDVGSGDAARSHSPGSPQEMAAAIIAAGKKARGEV